MEVEEEVWGDGLEAEGKGNRAGHIHLGVEEGGGQGCGAGDKKEGELFKEEPEPGKEMPGTVREGGAGQGKEIKEEENAGNGDDGGLDESAAEAEEEAGGEEEASAESGRGAVGEEEEEEGGEGEEAGEDVLALGEPGDGFDAEGVEGPEGGKEEEPGEADGGCQEAQKEEQKDGGKGVEEEVGEVVVAVGGEGQGGEKSVVEHVRNPEEGDIEATVSVELGEGALDGGKGDTVLDDKVGGDVGGVVDLDVGVSDGREEDGGDEKEEQERGQQKSPASGGRRAGGGWMRWTGWVHGTEIVAD